MVPNLPDVVTWSIPGFLLLIIVEVWSFHAHGTPTSWATRPATRPPA